MSCFTVGADEVVYFGIDSYDFLSCGGKSGKAGRRERRHTDDDSGIDMGVFRDEISDDGKSLVGVVGDREKNLEIGVFLSEGGLYIFIQVGFKALERA